MTPVPFELPLRPNEAAAMADLLFQQVEGKPLTEDQRGRFAGRLATLDLATIAAYPASLAADPVHGSTYYLAVDGLSHGVVTPLLLRIGLASAPATGLFPKSLMIGRVRPHGQREVVIGAVPFGPDDHESVRIFAESVDKSFLPRPLGAQPAQIVRAASAAGLAAALDSFRALPKQTLVAVETPSFWTAVWAAIRAGRRDGYGLGTVIDLSAGREMALRQVEAQPLHSKYVIECAAAADAAAVMDHVRRVKAGLASLYARAVDFELRLPDSAALPGALAELKAEGRAVQAVSAARLDLTAELGEFLRAANVPLVVEPGVPPGSHRVSVRTLMD